MPTACRVAIGSLWKDGTIAHAAHAGLILDKFLQSQRDDTAKEDGIQDRENLFKTAISACNAVTDIYAEAFSRYSTALLEMCVCAKFVTKNRLIVGFGGENVLESGITLHKTFGTPILSGSALKGLASHYCDQVWGSQDPQFRIGGEYHRILFGTTDEAGYITFYDGWITPESLTGSLRPDVLTPHHQEYYMKDAAPTDFDDPNPVTFLSVFGTFLIGVSCDDPGENGRKWADVALSLLSDALSAWGIGGKTSSGYGRMERLVVNNKVRLPEADTKRTGPLEFKPGDIVPVLVIPHPKKTDKIVFMTSDGYYGHMDDNLTPPVSAIGERCELKIKRCDTDVYWFVLP